MIANGIGTNCRQPATRNVQKPRASPVKPRGRLVALHAHREPGHGPLRP